MASPRGTDADALQVGNSLQAWALRYRVQVRMHSNVQQHVCAYHAITCHTPCVGIGTQAYELQFRIGLWATGHPREMQMACSMGYFMDICCRHTQHMQMLHQADLIGMMCLRRYLHKMPKQLPKCCWHGLCGFASSTHEARQMQSWTRMQQ